MHSIQVLVRPQFRSIYHLIQYLTHLHPSSQTWYIGSILLFYFWPTHLEHIVLQILQKSILSSFKTSLKSFCSCHNPDLPVSAWIKLCLHSCIWFSCWHLSVCVGMQPHAHMSACMCVPWITLSRTGASKILLLSIIPRIDLLFVYFKGFNKFKKALDCFSYKISN